MISNSTNPRFTMLHKTCNPRFRIPIFHDLQRCISTIYNFHDQLRKIHDLPLFTKNRRFTFQLSTICLLTTNPRFDRRFVRGGYLPLTQWYTYFQQALHVIVRSQVTAQISTDPLISAMYFLSLSFLIFKLPESF